MKLNFFQALSIKAKVTLFTLVIFLLSLWTLAFYASRMLRQDMQHLLSNQQLSTATFVAANVNDDLVERFSALEMLAASISPAILANRTALQAFLEQSLVFQHLFNGGSFVTGLDGTAIADVPLWTGRTGVNFMDRDYIAAALKNGKSTVSRPVIGKKLQAPVFAMTMPIRDAQGQIIGVLVGVTEVGKPNFLDNISRSNYGRSGNLLLVAAQYRLIITSSDRRRVMEELPAPGVDPRIDQSVRGQEGSYIHVNSRGVEVLNSSRKVPVAGWYVVVSLPTKEAFAPIREMQQSLLLSTLLLTLLAGGLTWWMVRRQLAPMLDTVKSLALMAQSDQHPPPLPIIRHDEIGQVIGGFNHMLAELRQRDALLRQVLNTVGVSIFQLDKAGHITLANRSMGETFRCSVETLQGVDYFTLVPADEYESRRQKMKAAIASGIEQLDADLQFQRADGTQFWGHVTARRCYDNVGQEQGLIGVIADISERKSADEKLRQHDNMLSAIIENFPGGISMMDADLRLTAHNKLFRQLLDFPDALLDKPGLCLEDLVRYNVQRGEYGPGDIEQQIATRVERARKFEPHRFDRVRPNAKVLEVRGEPLPGGGFVTMYLDITERKQMEEQVRQLAFYDPLTELPNRRLLLDRLTHALAESKRSGRYGALLFLDLDNFKALNDTAGHAVGDLLLMQAAKRMKSCVREVDTVARFGGDEFVVMVSDLDADKAASTTQANTIAEKIRSALAQPYTLTVKHDAQADAVVEHQCTASIGVVVFIDREGSQDDFLKWADSAMYQAKKAGGNVVQF